MTSKTGIPLPIWLHIQDNYIRQSDGFCPTRWVIDSVSPRQILVRVGSSDLSKFDQRTLDKLRLRMEEARFPFLLALRRSSTQNTFDSFACPCETVRRYIEAPFKPENTIPYVDQVLPQSVDIMGFEIGRFALSQSEAIHEMTL